MSLPYSSVYDLSGSVAEFTDECVVDNTGPGPAMYCAARGGDYGATAPGLRCDFYVPLALYRVEETVGFRCCKDLP
jgi:formylglycine-generating enzyme required for sulfatase activity